MKKSFLFVIIAAIVIVFNGCENKPQNLIVGKWYIVSYGETENDLMNNPFVESVGVKFKSDGTIWQYCINAYCLDFPIGKYKIDEKYFYRYDDLENEEIYTYSFDGDKFKISNINPKFAGNVHEYYTPNVFIFERIK